MSTATLAVVMLCVAAATTIATAAPRDTMPDTWAATDSLGRSLPGHREAGPPRPGKQVGIFYFLWLGQHGTHGPFDVSKILAAHPDAMRTPTSPPWGPLHAYHHWGEPLFGYYFSDDAWVLRRHAQMLADAQVDVVIFDVTNQATYDPVWRELCRVFAEVRRDGGRTPQIAFLTPFWDPRRVVRHLYDTLYKPELFPELWYRWKGKPLILADPAKVDDDVRSFFTFRKPQPSYFEGPTGPNQWGWLEKHPQHVFPDENGRPEQMTVGVAQNGRHGKLCAMSESDVYGRSWHRGARDSSPGAVSRGLNFQEQWDRALEVDPEFVFVTGWNEWIAMRLNEFAGVREPVMFVDQFNQEYSRDIEPMAGGHGDAYYWQLVANVRRYKGVRRPPDAGPPASVRIDGKFDDWRRVPTQFLDDLGDNPRRDHPAYEAVGRYVSDTSRNDFDALKVARDARNLYFYASTRAPLTPRSGANWMWLWLRVGDARPAWEGFQFMVSHDGMPEGKARLLACAGGWTWKTRATVACRASGREIELAIPRAALGLGTDGPFRVEFKWADNLQKPGDPLDLLVSGDTAPNARFRYVFEARP